ncbi:MAG: hypothetical protein AB1805_07495 [Nitrospirota bacterium]
MIATVIPQHKLSEIEAGTRKVHHLAASPFWKRRLLNRHHGAIQFLCGHKCRAFTIERIEYIATPEDVLEVILTPYCFALYLGGGLHLAEAGRDVYCRSRVTRYASRELLWSGLKS